jgi:hypothetical protein
MTDETEELTGETNLPETTEEATVATPEEEKKSNLQKRFDTITREKYEAMQEKDLIKKQNEELQAQLDTLNNKPAVEETLESHDYDEEAYNKAVIASEAEKAATRIIEQRDQISTKAAQQADSFAKAKEFASKEADFSSSVEDYDKVAKNPMLPINETMEGVILASDSGPALAYYLGSNPDQAYAIAQMEPFGAQRELLKIELGLNKPANVSNTPAPIPGDIGGNNTAVTGGLDDSLSTEEWIRRRNKQVHG